MSRLTNLYYDALTDALNIDPKPFQLYQGIGALPNDTYGLWNIFDAIPPLSINHIFDPGQFNFFSKNYGEMLLNFAPEDEESQEHATNAMIRYLGTGDLYGYDITHDDIQNALHQNGQPLTVKLQYHARPDTNSSSYAGRNTQGDVNFFSLSGEHAAFDQQLIRAKITCNISRYVVQPGVPTAIRRQEDVGLNPWYDHQVMKQAYESTQEENWNTKSGAWKDYFGNSGDLQRFCGEILVCDGIEVKTTADTTMSPGNQKQLEDIILTNGVFPFFAPANTGADNRISISEYGEMTSTTRIERGTLCILGVMVYPVSDYLAKLDSLQLVESRFSI